MICVRLFALVPLLILLLAAGLVSSDVAEPFMVLEVEHGFGKEKTVSIHLHQSYSHLLVNRLFRVPYHLNVYLVPKFYQFTKRGTFKIYIMEGKDTPIVETGENQIAPELLNDFKV